MLPEQRFVVEGRIDALVQGRVDVWMADRIAPVLAYLHHCEEGGGSVRTEEVRRLLVEGLAA